MVLAYFVRRNTPYFSTVLHVENKTIIIVFVYLNPSTENKYISAKHIYQMPRFKITSLYRLCEAKHIFYIIFIKYHLINFEHCSYVQWYISGPLLHLQGQAVTRLLTGPGY